VSKKGLTKAKAFRHFIGTGADTGGVGQDLPNPLDKCSQFEKSYVYRFFQLFDY